MPVYNYEKQAEKENEKTINDKEISKENIEAYKRYMEQNNNKPSSKSKFSKHIRPFLRTFEVNTILDKHFKNDEDDEQKTKARREINQFFGELREKISLSYYGTIVSTTLTFVTWVNDGKPYVFKDVKKPKNKETRRKLKPSDMINKEDRNRLIKEAKSVQLKAMISVQLDGGFRTGEFLDIKYGDVSEPEQEQGIITITTIDGKTGERHVTLRDCAPELLAWMDAHPTKKPEDPLWVQEQSKEIKPYSNNGVKNKIKRVADKLGINKPFDLYNLRHSACYLAKLENIPADLAAKKFGHSITHYTETYGRLDANDQVQRLKNHLRAKPSKENHNICSRCKTVNNNDKDYCVKCGYAISYTAAIKYKEEKENIQKQLDDLKAAFAEHQKAIEKMNKSF